MNMEHGKNIEHGTWNKNMNMAIVLIRPQSRKTADRHKEMVSQRGMTGLAKRTTCQ
jgi:hypothetical protein